MIARWGLTVSVALLFTAGCGDSEGSTAGAGGTGNLGNTGGAGNTGNLGGAGNEGIA